MSAVCSTVLAVFSFCLISSAIYCINDILDADSDLSHPRKCKRPIPSGRVSPRGALVLAAGLVSIATGIAALSLPVAYIVFAALYLINGLVYSLVLKHRVIADVLAIAVGFVIRLLAGCAAIEVAPTSWILLCGFSLATLLGLGKRRLELGRLDSSSRYRRALESYTVANVDTLLAVSCTLCLMSYSLYTVAPQTIDVHKTDKLIYTIPFVTYGVFRYILKVQEARHDSPVDVLMRDWVFMLNGLIRMISCVVLMYL